MNTFIEDNTHMIQWFVKGYNQAVKEMEQLQIMKTMNIAMEELLEDKANQH